MFSMTLTYRKIILILVPFEYDARVMISVKLKDNNYIYTYKIQNKINTNHYFFYYIVLS